MQINVDGFDRMERILHGTAIILIGIFLRRLAVCARNIRAHMAADRRVCGLSGLHSVQIFIRREAEKRPREDR